jgi:hypothetical protein
MGCAAGTVTGCEPAAAAGVETLAGTNGMCSKYFLSTTLVQLSPRCSKARRYGVNQVELVSGVAGSDRDRDIRDRVSVALAFTCSTGMFTMCASQLPSALTLTYVCVCV